MKKLDGPVLFQIIFRSNAKAGFVPKIADNYTLTNSLLADNGSAVTVGTGNVFSIASSGIITFALGQTFPGVGGGITSITAGTGLIGGTITTSGTLSLDTSFTDMRYAPAGAAPAILTGYCNYGGPQVSNTRNVSSAIPLIGLGADTNGCVGGGGFSYIDATMGVPMPSAGLLNHLWVAVSNTAGTFIVGVYVNGSATPLTCLGTAPSTVPILKCSDTTHSVSVAAGDLVAVGVVTPPGQGFILNQVRATLEKH